jgi:uncharacterized protein (TIGR00369 family)
MTFVAQDQDFGARVQASFNRQTFLHTLGARLTSIEPGRCTIELAARSDLCQQHGYLHAGVTTTIADVAAGYAAYSLMPADTSVLTLEFKINLLAPAKGERLIARAEVLKPGKRLTVVRSDVVAIAGGRERLVATMLATMFCVHGQDTAGQP